MTENRMSEIHTVNLYMLNIMLEPKAQRKFAKEFILNFLDGKEVETSYLDEQAKAVGISKNTLNRAKTELIKEGKIKYRNEGFGKNKKFFTYMVKTGMEM